MKRVVVTGRSVDDAVTSALVKLGVPRSQAQIKVISEPVKGFLGFIGAKDAEVEVSIQLSPQEAAKDFLQGVLQRMNVAAEVSFDGSAEVEDEEVTLNIQSSEDALPFLIGRHGSTLDSLSYLVNLFANRNHEGFMKFVVDAGNYRKRRRDSLRRVAEQAADRAVKAGRPVSLDSMSSADRKWVHTFLQLRDDVLTSSEGQDPHRRVKIIPKRKTYRNA